MSDASWVICSHVEKLNMQPFPLNMNHDKQQRWWHLTAGTLCNLHKICHYRSLWQFSSCIYLRLLFWILMMSYLFNVCQKLDQSGAGISLKWGTNGPHHLTSSSSGSAFLNLKRSARLVLAERFFFFGWFQAPRQLLTSWSDGMMIHSLSHAHLPTRIGSRRVC